MLSVKREKVPRDASGRPSSSDDCERGTRQGVDDVVDGSQTPRPTQTPSSVPGVDFSDRRAVRSRYRELKSQVIDRKGKLAQDDMEDFNAFIRGAERLHTYVNKNREAISDAELFQEITKDILSVATGAQVKGGMSAAEFVGAIILTYGIPGSVDADAGQSIDWEALGLESCSILRTAPGVSTMVGPMEVELKPRKVTVHRKRERPTEKTRPESVEEVDADLPSTETDANMTTMYKTVCEREQVQLDHLILNRVSFAQTIENLFALSFLVKDGRVEIKFDDNKVQFVVPKNAPAHAERAEGKVNNTQFVFRLDFQCWRLMTETVPEGEELMPHRGNAERSANTGQTARTPIRKNSRNRARQTPTLTPPDESPEDGSGGQSQRFKRRLLGSLISGSE